MLKEAARAGFQQAVVDVAKKLAADLENVSEKEAYVILANTLIEKKAAIQDVLYPAGGAVMGGLGGASVGQTVGDLGGQLLGKNLDIDPDKASAILGGLGSLLGGAAGGYMGYRGGQNMAQESDIKRGLESGKYEMEPLYQFDPAKLQELLAAHQQQGS